MASIGEAVLPKSRMWRSAELISGWVVEREHAGEDEL
jgi:hypothetical protein